MRRERAGAWHKRSLSGWRTGARSCIGDQSRSSAPRLIRPHAEAPNNYNPLIGACQEGSAWHACLLHLQLMTRDALPPDAIVGYSSTCRSLLQSDQLDLALKLMKEMQLERVDLGQFASIVLTASMKQGNWLKSQALLPLGAFRFEICLEAFLESFQWPARQRFRRWGCQVDAILITQSASSPMAWRRTIELSLATWDHVIDICNKECSIYCHNYSV